LTRSTLSAARLAVSTASVSSALRRVLKSDSAVIAAVRTANREKIEYSLAASESRDAKPDPVAGDFVSAGIVVADIVSLSQEAGQHMTAVKKLYEISM
jgi:hypothetical protein